MWNRAEPDLAAFDEMANKAYEALPEPFRDLARSVVVRVADFPTAEVMRGFDMDSPYGLLGLYQGVDRTRRSIHDTGRLPDMVWLYREPILRYARERTDTLEDVITHVLVHEIGHHFGLSDDDMYGLEDEAE